MNKNIILSIIVLAVILVSCDKEDVDSTKPTIEIVEPHHLDEFMPGEFIPINVIFRDNVELKEYKVDIHYNPDGHAHGRVLATEAGWSHTFSDKFDPGKKEVTINITIQIPEKVGDADIAHGEYHIGIYCTDASNNESVEFIEIHIEEEEDH